MSSEDVFRSYKPTKLKIHTNIKMSLHQKQKSQKNKNKNRSHIVCHTMCHPDDIHLPTQKCHHNSAASPLVCSHFHPMKSLQAEAVGYGSGDRRRAMQDCGEWWSTLITTVPKRWRQDKSELQARLHYKESSKPAQARRFLLRRMKWG